MHGWDVLAHTHTHAVHRKAAIPDTPTCASRGRDPITCQTIWHKQRNEPCTRIVLKQLPLRNDGEKDVVGAGVGVPVGVVLRKTFDSANSISWHTYFLGRCHS